MSSNMKSTDGSAIPGDVDSIDNFDVGGHSSVWHTIVNIVCTTVRNKPVVCVGATFSFHHLWF